MTKSRLSLVSRQTKPKAGKLKKLPASALQLGQNIPKFSNLNKPLYPNGFTKGQVIDYYRRAAERILPFLYGRGVTLKRWPDGVMKQPFFEKRCPSHKPDWVNTATVRRSDDGEMLTYCTIDSLSTLLWVANLASIELHVPLALADEPNRPTEMVFDLDPGPPAGVKEAAVVALQLRDLLKRVGLESFIKTSGSKGLHMLVPLNGAKVTFDDTKSFSRAVAMLMAKQNPKEIVSEMNRALRPGKVFIDWSQNDQHKTTVCCWSMRGTTMPSVSAPLKWSQIPKLATAIMDPEKALKVDPKIIEPVLTLRQDLPRLKK